MGLVVMFAIWIVLGLLAGALAGPIWKGRRPIGVAGDYLVAVVVTILVGLADWYLIPAWLGLEGPLKFAAAVVEPALSGLVALWIVRAIKKPQVT